MHFHDICALMILFIANNVPCLQSNMVIICFCVSLKVINLHKPYNKLLNYLH